MKERTFGTIILAGLLAGAAGAADLPNVPTTVENGAFVRRNGNYFNNRPLYCSHGNPANPYYWVLTGDRPLVRMAGDPQVDATFLLGFQRTGGAPKWLQDFQSVEARYPGGRMEWVVSDPAFPGVTVRLQGLPLGEGTGMAIQAQVEGAQAGDRLVWLLGGSYHRDYVHDMDALVFPAVREEGFDPANAEGNRVQVDKGVIRIEPAKASEPRYTLAACGTPSELRVVDAGLWQKPAELLASQGGNRPMVCGVTPVGDARPIQWVVRSWPRADKAAAAPNVPADFRLAWERVEGLRHRVVVKTPEPRLDAAVTASIVANDGIWRSFGHAHSGMGTWCSPLLGWRVSYGSIVYGGNDRLLTQARHFISSQMTGEKLADHPELQQRVKAQTDYLNLFVRELTRPGIDSDFYSKGRLIPDGNSQQYDMQSQFFDQAIESWRFTADPEMEKLLRPALELHLGYIERCFDPDGDGAYESFINTWPTDNQWYNGGGTVEETCYAFRGHLAARDMARRAGDAAAVKRHEAKLALIRKAFFEKLWVAEAGHPGAYREQGGHQRLHPDPWLYSIHQPFDCPGLLNDEQMASTLHFAEYGLEHEPRPSGGYRVQLSNWVPGIWSLRLMSQGDNYALAQAYFVAGLPERGFEILRGTYHESALESVVPGNFGMNYGGTDFGECHPLFARAVVSGLFGYRPDRPNGRVIIAPQFPAAWDQASIEHPEFSLAFKREGKKIRLEAGLKNPCAMELVVPFRGMGLAVATLNGKRVDGEIRPGFGTSLFALQAPATGKAVLELDVAEPLPQAAVHSREVVRGEEAALEIKDATILEIRDAQGVFEKPQLTAGKVTGRIAALAGDHRLLVLVKAGSAPQWRVFDFKVSDPKTEAYAAEKYLRQAPANALWHCVDIAAQRNGRVGEIFRQEYLSPRPKTISARLAKDGFRTWQATMTGERRPYGIDLSNTRPDRPVPVYEGALGKLKLEGSCTLEAWVAADAMAPSGGRILDMGGLVLDTVPGTSMRMLAGKNAIYTVPLLCGERLTHIAMVYDLKQKQIFAYADGNRLNWRTDITDSTPPVLAEKFFVGADPAGGNRLLGAIKRVAIAGRAFTPDEVKNRTCEAPALEGTLADWRFPDDGPAQVASSVGGAPTLQRKDMPFQRAAGTPARLPLEQGELVTSQGAHFLWNIGEKDIAFTSLWDNWPKKVTVPVNQKGDSVWLLVAGSTNPMQVRIANAVLRFLYADGTSEQLELVPPYNFWSLCPFVDKDYDMNGEAFSMPKQAPPQVQLGNYCRAMVYGWKLRPGVALKEVTLETLSQEVVIGLMGVSVCTAK
jgi:hypothetical protein